MIWGLSFIWGLGNGGRWSGCTRQAESCWGKILRDSCFRADGKGSRWWFLYAWRSDSLRNLPLKHWHLCQQKCCRSGIFSPFRMHLLCRSSDASRLSKQRSCIYEAGLCSVPSRSDACCLRSAQGRLQFSCHSPLTVLRGPK